MKHVLFLLLSFHMICWAVEPDPWERKLVGDYVKTEGGHMSIVLDMKIFSEMGHGDIRRISGSRYQITIYGANLEDCEILISTPEEARMLMVVGVRGTSTCLETFSGTWNRTAPLEDEESESAIRQFVDGVVGGLR